jgi:Mg/Co/Ni transporter MgtE
VLVEVSGAVRDSLIEATPHDDLVALLLTLDPDDLAYLVESVPADVLNAVSRGLEQADRSAFDEATRYGEESVGRYMSRLISAPVVDDRGKLIGRLTVDAVMDYVRDMSNLQALKSAGLTADEDLFASPWDSARNRGPGSRSTW